MATDSKLFQLEDQLVNMHYAIAEVKETMEQEVKYMEGTLQTRQIELWITLQNHLQHLTLFSSDITKKLEEAIIATQKKKS